MKTTERYRPMKDPKYCFVPECKNNSRDARKTFFAVPNSRKEEWCNAVGITCRKRVLYICEDHLILEEDVENYRYWITMNGRPKLKSRLPQSLVRTLLTTQAIIEPTPSTSSEIVMDVDMDMLNKNPVITKSHKGVQMKAKTSDKLTECTILEHVLNGPLLKDMAENISIKEELPSTQGSTTSADMSEVSSEVSIETVFQGRSFMHNIIKKKPEKYLGLPNKYYWLVNYLQNQLKLKSFNIIVTLYKIKNNIPFYQISDMFEVSLTTLWKIFLRTLNILSEFFKQLIFAPSQFNVKKNLPSSFKTNKDYSNVYCIIDCFEIEIEKPLNPVIQSLTWSQCKNTYTLKYLLATTPDGFINFASSGFGGRISDTNLVELSGLIDVLPPKCIILADRGFKHVDILLSKKQIKLLRPPSVSNVRIHVERVMRRVRQFNFLKPHSVINKKLIKHADEVVIVACGLINLDSSIVKK